LRESRRPGGLAEAVLQLGGLPAAGFQTVRVADRSLFPFTAIGKLFMTFDGRDRVGTAWVIGDRAVFTAGHCVYDELAEDAWADNVLFVPQFHQGQEPAGRWAARSVHSLAGWAARGADMRRFDMGGAILDRPVAPITGSIGWLANHGPAQAYVSVGYPRNRLSDQYPFDGQEMWRCTGRYESGSNPFKMANNMTRGCSGGPMLAPRNGRIYAAGLNSFREPGEPLTVQSPHFGNAFLNLVAAIS